MLYSVAYILSGFFPLSMKTGVKKVEAAWVILAGTQAAPFYCKNISLDNKALPTFLSMNLQ